MNLAHALAESARAVPDRPAIVVDDRVDSSYAALAERVSRRAGDLATQGVNPGDRVAIYMSNRPDYLEALFAIWWAGAVAVPLSSMLHPREAADLIDDCAATFTWVSPDLANGLDTHLPVGDRVRVVDDGELQRSRQSDAQRCAEVPGGSDAWLFYTSGTTGKPKGARLTHANLWAMSLAYCSDVEWVDERSGLLHLALQSHASGLFALPFIARGGAQVVPTSTDPEHVANLLGVHERLSFFVPPILLRRLAADPAIAAAPVDRMGTVLVGAAPVHADDLRAGMATFGPRLWNGYGQGETPCTITALGPRAMAEADRRGDIAALGSVGVARVGTRVAIMDPDGNHLPDGEIGEVVVKGPTVMAGYLDRPEATAETLRGGWLHTGDLGRFEGGLLTLLDRSKDMVITGGANVYPREVEDVIRLHPHIADIAVIGVPDPEWGERVVAFVVPEAGSTVTDDALDAYCLSSMARYKRPKEYHVVSELPRNGAGKVLKTQLREQLADSTNTDTDNKE
jgi:long-chain acyl-CoA synthetase